MIQRHAEHHLMEWYRSRRRKPLVLRRARQVGKSTLVRQFAANNDLALAEINLERHYYLDLYYAHMPDYATSLEETHRAMDDLVCQGKVRYLGCSNFRAFQLCKALWISDKLNLARWDCIQPPYNLLARDVEYELLPLCEEEGVGVCVFSPMAAGFLSGKYEKDAKPIEGARFGLAHLGYRYNQPYWAGANFSAVEKLTQTAEKYGNRPPEFALAWVLSNKTITAIVCGATTVEQLEQNMGAVDTTLPKEALDSCDAV